MADDAFRVLLCLVEGDSSLFKVNPTSNVDIIQLKVLIKEKGIDNAILAEDLVLWKVRISMAADGFSETLVG